MKRNMSEISEIRNYSAVAEFHLKWLQACVDTDSSSFTRLKGVCSFLQSIFIYYPRVHTPPHMNMVGELIR